MKPRQIIILLVLLAVLVGVIYVKQTQQPPEVVEEEYTEQPISVDREQVTAIEVSKGMNAPGLRVEKTEDVWRLPERWNFPVKASQVDTALSMVSELKGELRGSDSALFADFGIDDETAFHVRMLGAEGGELLNLLIGTEQPRYSSSFVRAADSDNVFLVDYNLLQTFAINKDSDEFIREASWADLAIAHFDSVDITAIRIVRSSEDGATRTLELSKTTDPESGRGRWAFARAHLPFAVGAPKVTAALDAIGRLTATTFVDPDGEGYGLDDPYLVATLTPGEGEVPLVFTVGAVSDESTEARYLKTAQVTPVLTLSKYSIQKFELDESDFFPDNPLGVDTERLESVTIHVPDGEEVIQSEQFEEKKDTIDRLKNIAAGRLLESVEEANSVGEGGDRWIKLKPKEGDPVILDVGGLIGENQNEYAARLRDGTQAFAISKESLQTIFES